jgi:hypothetical protein
MENPLTNPLATAKEIGSIIKKYNDLPLMEKVVELSDEIRSLQEENRALRQQLEEKQEMVARGPNNYFYRGDAGPYCPTCWQGHNKLVLLPAEQTFAGGQGRRCAVCEKLFIDAPRHEPIQIKPRVSQWG